MEKVKNIIKQLVLPILLSLGIMFLFRIAFDYSWLLSPIVFLISLLLVLIHYSNKYLSLVINNILVFFKEKFFENDISAFKWTFCIFIIPLILYEVPFKICSKWSICYFDNSIDFISFLALWATVVGMFLAFLVMLNINNKRTKTGSDFIQLISNELHKLKNSEEITIISPNINIGSYKYRGESIFEVALKKAINRGVKVKYITLGLDNAFLKAIDVENYSDSFINAESNKSPQLKYIYDTYIHPAKVNEIDAGKSKSPGLHLKNLFKRSPNMTSQAIASMTIEELKDLIDKIEIIYHCKYKEFIESNLIGFYTSEKIFIGEPEESNEPHKGRVNVVGEIIQLGNIVTEYPKQLEQKFNNIKIDD